MALRVRLAPEQLETRDTPSVPPLDPFGGYTSLPASPVVPTTAVPIPSLPAPAPVPGDPPRGFWSRAAFDVVAGPLVAEHSVYKVPLVLPGLPR
jgi:hypothetical protein